ncbi:MAG: ATP-binding protein [Longimicrobiales bacterium]|nr:ATP-binding protein [Longimicrobiales bacterium]
MSEHLDRPVHRARLTALLRQFPVVAVLGARQVGKTTLARQLVAARRGPTAFFDLENAADLARLADPLLALRRERGLVVIDEIHRLPDLFPTLRVLVDEPGARRRFLVLGSAAPELLRQGSETLAGRIAYHELEGFRLDEVGPERLARLWLRGGFPRSFVARTEAESGRWREEFIRTFLERDIPQFGLRVPAPALRRFWSMLAHYHAQTWNGSELARAFGVAHTTVQRYLDVLTETYMVRQLPPWHANLAKRQVRSPKVYLRDVGLLHSLLGIHTPRDLEGHPKVGASWEGFALGVTLDRLGARPGEAYFWGTHSGAELDLIVVRGSTRLGFEFKRTSAPSVTHSMRTALADLELQRLDVIHGGRETFPLSDRIRAVPLERVWSDVAPLA